MTQPFYVLKRRRGRAGFTMVELVIVIALIGILASAFVGVLVPMMNFFFYYPESSRVNSAAADLMEIILEGDDQARGLRYAGLSCDIGGGGGGASGITAATSSGSTQTLTYNYVDSDYCGSSAARVSHTVTLVYDSSTGTVTRAIDGGSASVIPKYVGSASDINFTIPGGGTQLFRYFSINADDMGTAPLSATIGYVKNVGNNNSKTAGTSLAVTVPGGGVARGNLLAVYFAMDGDTTAPTCADTKGSVYTVGANAQFASPGTGNVRTTLFYAPVNTALVSGDTITVTHPSVTARAMSVSEFSNVNTFHTSAATTGTSTTPSSGNAATTVANTLLVGAIGAEGPVEDSFTPGGSYNAAPPTEDGTTTGTAATNITMDPEYRVVGAAGNYPADGTITSRDWAAALAVFYNSAIYRVDVEVIAIQGNGEVGSGAGQIRLKSGVDIKQYTT